MSRGSLVTQRQLLSALSSGSFHSGQVLAEMLGVSRTAVANHIKQLQQLGLDIYKVKGRGYCLVEQLDLLDAARISQLRKATGADILVQHITDSTNTQLMQKIQDGLVTEPGYTIVAEAQTAGRGRRGRNWYSPFAASLYFSMYWRLEQGIQAAMGLSLVVGIAIARLLKQQYQVDARVKWPNDVYVDGKKLCGILVELAGQAHAGCDVIIGIGMNIRLPQQALHSIDQQYIDLTGAAEKVIDRNQLVALLQQQLITLLADFTQQGFTGFVDEFDQYNQYRNKAIRLIGKEEITGICIGVDKQGALLVKTAAGVQAYFGGELSLRAGE
ncbi:bifunctional biotin--[acetyl-CoA-carboxylase] ligase/biotin operon repressor BirA [Rheinheimera baltica]|uniref:Bifunctional ligase/repressor BirA n=1 Tax=Rheinheimera baltica TaxID=67576 RepID=A0ABT9I522_9GAMM|nr:bifunctional biotin--[acetyl-CoA-carboxylase] ligase/biotin operon repressor BirA [Rheinheimera baltica]MDP5138506.1 bifunctional biotin--[acetyl-CoA-carboxylase] ligase/biotin operon repressor BirA [Rheinheimera baltica]MDP5144800.1 bifunctional biotin--[acetyl-CoA-carboxylase] ligase/biotin operon repressor BirA [Rheinheimera baltica]MDP5191654.1 bifunctional biotin--[acetyl-CoA-carboxylase] ligase/biotin operon repressor BirA [Rheinheimera baltica]